MDYVYNKDDVPKTPHYAIITFDSMWIPGDQRSIDAPGHGYPERTETVVHYIVFTDRDEWEREISRREVSKDNPYMALFVTPATVSVEVKTHIEVK